MRHLSLAASAIAVGTAVLYIAVLVKQGAPISPFTTSVVTGALVALAVLAVYGSLGPAPGLRALALWAAIPGFFGLGFLAGFSIGAFLLIGGALTLPAAISALRGIAFRPRAVMGWTIVIVLTWAIVLAMLLIPVLPLLGEFLG